MVSIRDKFLSSHRSQIKSSLWGKLNVFYSVVFFNSLDAIILSYFWFLHYVAIRDFECDSFLMNMIFNTVITFIPLLSLIKNSFIFYGSFIVYLIRFWHLCHMYGKFLGLLIFHMVRISRTLQNDLQTYYANRLIIFSSSTIVGVIRLIVIILSLWYSLILQRIRFAGGTGFEMKTAEEFESESLDKYLKGDESGHVQQEQESESVKII